MEKLDLTGIKAIIFDLGGVILNIDYNKTQQAFEALGIQNFNELYSQARQSKLFDRLETGELTPEEFRTSLCKLSEKELADTEIDKAWNAMLLDLPEERKKLLLELKNKYRTYLLSNTNEIHVTAFSGSIIARKELEKLFDKVYFSNEIKMRKPNPEVFEFVLKENNLKAEETLFVDDSIQHIEGAQKVGIRAVLLEKGTSIMDLFC